MPTQQQTFQLWLCLEPQEVELNRKVGEIIIVAIIADVE